jgi:hypothetical protein
MVQSAESMVQSAESMVQSAEIMVKLVKNAVFWLMCPPQQEQQSKW